MIFPQLLSLMEEHIKEEANANGSYPFKKATPTTEEIAQKAAHQRQVLIDNACMPIDDAAELFDFDADEYRLLAQRNQALLFVTSEGEELVPKWSFDNNKKINPVAVEVGKIYVHRRPNPLENNCVNFVLFLGGSMISLDSTLMFTEEDEPKPLSWDFKRRAYEDSLKIPEYSGAERSIRKAITIALGPNKEYVEQAVYARVHNILGSNQSLEAHAKEVRDRFYQRMSNTL